MRYARVLYLLLVVSCGGSTAPDTERDNLSDGGGKQSSASGGASNSPDSSSGECPAGSERCPCYGNQTCNAPLTCASDLCVNLTTDAGTTEGPDADSSDTSADGAMDSGLSSSGGTSGDSGMSGSGGSASSDASVGGDNDASSTGDGANTDSSVGTGAPDANGGHDGMTDDAATSRPSCIGLPATCGPNGDEDCCTDLYVPGGTYNRSNDSAYPATVSSFRLDRFEVTVGRFRKFVEAYDAWRAAGNPVAGAGAHALIPDSGWDPSWSAALPADAAMLVTGIKYDCFASWTDAPGANELRPINCIDSLEAFAFCAWDSARQPTEAEWNYAAAGGYEQRIYPWGNDAPSLTYANYSCLGDGVAGCTLDDLLAVGSTPAGDGRYGQADLAGNIYEWNRDQQNCCTAPWPGYPTTTCFDCAYLTGGSGAALRGGSFAGDETWLANSFRGWGGPRVYDIGARCARSP